MEISFETFTHFQLHCYPLECHVIMWIFWREGWFLHRPTLTRPVPPIHPIRSDPIPSHPIRSSTPHSPREQVVANPNWTSRQKIYEEGISIFYTVISGNAKLLLRVAEIYLVRYMKVISE